MLETSGVGRVTRDGYVYIFVPHDGNAFANVVGAVAVNGSTGTVAVRSFLHDVKFAREIVELGLHVRETVDAADNHGSVLAETVKDAAQGLVGGS